VKTPAQNLAIEFDEALHLYYVRGREVPSVSRVLKDLKLTGYFSGAATLEAMARGSRVHLLTQRDDEGSTKPPENSDESGYLDAWREWRSSFGGVVDAIEFRIQSSKFRYAGTIDRIIRFPSGRIVVVEIKTGAEARWHRLQTSAYTTAYVEDGHAPGIRPEQVERLAVYLNPDGTYRERLHQNPADLQGWRSAITLWHWSQCA
jgi:hypothetical protein